MRIVDHDPTAITRLFGPGMEEMDFSLLHVKTGGAYRPTCIVIREHDLVPCMVYKSAEDGTRWSRPLKDFFSKTDDGQPKWRWNAKADRIMEMIRSALGVYDAEKLTR